MNSTTLIGKTLDKIEILLNHKITLAEYNKLEEILYDLADDVVSEKTEARFFEGFESGKAEGQKSGYSRGFTEGKLILKDKIIEFLNSNQ